MAGVASGASAGEGEHGWSWVTGTGRNKAGATFQCTAFRHSASQLVVEFMTEAAHVMLTELRAMSWADGLALCGRATAWLTAWLSVVGRAFPHSRW